MQVIKLLVGFSSAVSIYCQIIDQNAHSNNRSLERNNFPAELPEISSVGESKDCDLFLAKLVPSHQVMATTHRFDFQ